MKKRLLILTLLIVGIFSVSFGSNNTVSGAYCPYNQACDPRLPYNPDYPQCGDCSCQQICEPTLPFCKKKYVCGT